jgi:hypothetical protein
MQSFLWGAHSSDPEAELDSMYDDERRPGPRHDVDTFGLGDGDTLRLWVGDSLGDCRGEHGNGNLVYFFYDGFGDSVNNRMVSDDDKPPRSFGWCYRSVYAHVTQRPRRQH